MQNLLKMLFVALSVTTVLVNGAWASSSSAAEGGGGAELSDTVKKYLRYVILGKGTAPTAIEMLILRRDPEFTARRILIEIRDTMTDDKRIWELDRDLCTARAYLQGSALAPDYIERRVRDVIRGVNNDILEHMKHRVIMSRDNTLTDAEVRAFYDEYQTLDEALSHGASVKKFVIAPHDHALLREVKLPYLDANPAVTLVVSFDGVNIPDRWLVPRNVRRLAIIGPNVERIGDYFLGYNRAISYRNALRELDFSSLARVTSIGNGFLAGCSRLTALDLSPLANVTSIGVNFLSGCKSLRELDLRPLARVTRIGDVFLASCSGLRELDLRPLAKVTSIGDAFLSGCSGLRELDLRPLTNVTSIGDGFLWGCSGLRELDLRPLTNVTSIGKDFLRGCINLTALDLRPLANVTSIGKNFLRACINLTALDLSPLASVTSIGYGFLMHCRALDSVNIKGLNPTIKADIRKQPRMRHGRLRIIE